MGMSVMAQSDCQTVWKYIPFKFNQTHIAEAQELALQIGIKKFHLDFSDRFDKKTEHLKPTADYLGDRLKLQTQWKISQTIPKLDPKCKQGNQHYITADGYYSPCCFLADHRFYYKNQFGKNKNQYNITKTTLSQILTAPAVIDFYQSLDQQSGCQYNCPKLTIDQ